MYREGRDSARRKLWALEIKVIKSFFKKIKENFKLQRFYVVIEVVVTVQHF